MQRTTLNVWSPKVSEALGQIHSLIAEGKLHEATGLYEHVAGFRNLQAQIQLEADFLQDIRASFEIDKDRSPSQVSARAAVILAAVVGWRGDEPSSWTRPVAREDLLAWAQSHYQGLVENLVIALDAIVLQGLFFDVHPAVFGTTCYYCSFDPEFLDELPPDSIPLDMWKHDFPDNTGLDVAKQLWSEWPSQYDDEFGFTWWKTGLCWGQGSQSGNSPWGPCVGSGCVAYRTGDTKCTQNLPFNSDLRPPKMDNTHTVFISYGGPDEKFATRLYNALERRGIRTWFFPRDAVPGQKLHDAMRDGVNTHAKVIAVCSKASLERPGFQNEMEQTLAREAREGGAPILLPITIDDYMFAEWKPSKPAHRQELLDRVVADFRDAHTLEHDAAKFNAAINRLIKALRK